MESVGIVNKPPKGDPDIVARYNRPFYRGLAVPFSNMSEILQSRGQSCKVIFLELLIVFGVIAGIAFSYYRTISKKKHIILLQKAYS